MADSEPKPCPLCFRGKERGKYLAEDLIWYPLTGIGYTRNNPLFPVILVKCRPQSQNSSILHRLDSIQYQIEQDLLNLLWIDIYGWEVVLEIKYFLYQSPLAAPVLGGKHKRLFQHCIKVRADRIWLCGPSEEKEIVYGLVEPFHLIQHLDQDLLSWIGWKKVIIDYRYRRRDSGKRILYLMGNPCCHFSDGCQPVRPLHLVEMIDIQLLFRFLQSLYHGVETVCQSSDLIFRSMRDSYGKIPRLYPCHLFNNPVERGPDKTEHDESDGKREKCYGCNGGEDE